MSRPIVVLLSGVVSCTLFMILHAANWEPIFGKRPKPPWSYVAGVLGLAVPFSVVMVLWGDWWSLATAASVVMGGGGAVLFGYKTRGLGPVPNEAGAGQEAIIKALRGQVEGLERKLMALEGGGRWRKETTDSHPKV